MRTMMVSTYCKGFEPWSVWCARHGIAADTSDADLRDAADALAAQAAEHGIRLDRARRAELRRGEV